MRPLTVREICERVVTKCPPPKSPRKQSPTDHQIDLLLTDPKDDEYALELFPPRTKEDIGIRNLCMGDMLLFMRRKGILECAAHILRLRRAFDNILTSNCLLADICML